MAEANLVNQYFSRIPHVRYVFKDGSVANFTGDRFTTTEPAEISELDAAVAAKNQVIYTKPGMERVDPESLDPVLAFKKQVIAEYLANQAAASGNPNRDMGKSDSSGGVKPASTQAIAAITANQAASTFNVPASLAAALNLVTPQNDAATHVPSEATSVDPDVAAGMKALSVFGD